MSKLPEHWQGISSLHPVCRDAESRFIAQLVAYEMQNVLSQIPESLVVGWADGSTERIIAIQKRYADFGENTHLGLTGEGSGILFVPISYDPLLLHARWGYTAESIELFQKKGVRALSLRPFHGDSTLESLQNLDWPMVDMYEYPPLLKDIFASMRNKPIYKVIDTILKRNGIAYDSDRFQQNTVASWQEKYAK